MKASTMDRRRRTVLAITMAFASTCVLAACGGGSSESSAAAVQGERTSGAEREEGEDGTEITGLLGTIPTDQVDLTMQARMGQFQRCLEQRMREVEFLGGDVRLSFRIRTDGTVAWVYPSQSTFGDRQAERCILEVAARARFPRPRGGEAEASWGFGIDPPEDVRAPLTWEATRVGPALLQGAPDLGARCNARGVRVTAYIAPGGHVLTAGASTPSPDQLAGVDCVVEAVRALRMPDPGSYAAKVTFLVP